MNNKEILEKIKRLTSSERRNISYDELVDIINKFSPDEIIELSNIIGYPVFTRLCMGVLNHKFVLLQDGAAAVILNDEGQILLQSRVDNDRWGLPGGCQELGERFEDTIIREIKEETNLDVLEEDLINNTALFCVRNYTGNLSWDEESKNMRFFDLDNLPLNQHDPDLIDAYIKYLGKRKNK